MASHEIGGDQPDFGWTRFYEQVAKKLLAYKEDRPALLNGLIQISESLNDETQRKMFVFNDKFDGNREAPIEDMCPFTFMGIFNRGHKVANRTAAAAQIGKFLDVTIQAPTNFDGIPVVQHQSSWFFGYAYERQTDDIDSLWRVFESSQHLKSNPAEQEQQEFIERFNRALKVKYVKLKKLTMALYWTRPLEFVSLDSPNQNCIESHLKRPVPFKEIEQDGAKYLDFLQTMKKECESNANSFNSFPELSYLAWIGEPEEETVEPPEVKGTLPRKDPNDDDEQPNSDQPIDHSYSLSDLIADGCFLSESKLGEIEGGLRRKKNLILQGPPGTGKSWLAKRLGWVLIGSKNSPNLTAVQFHPNLSYEDFVRGFRPTGGGTLAIEDGVFMKAIGSAVKKPNEEFVVVIEEINRGNPAQIFGELLTLLEADKRNDEEALTLTYSHSGRELERVHVPPNLHIIGTMNLADRSLALVDFALRRRFAFVDLKPELSRLWQEYVVDKLGVDVALAQDIATRINRVNLMIKEDERLGSSYLIGHSFVTPSARLDLGVTGAWFRDVVETELLPLLNEYWFDEPKNIAEAKSILIDNWVG